MTFASQPPASQAFTAPVPQTSGAEQDGFSLGEEDLARSSSFSLKSLALLVEAANSFLDYFDQARLSVDEIEKYQKYAISNYRGLSFALDEQTFLRKSLQALSINEAIKIDNPKEGFGSNTCMMLRQILSKKSTSGGSTIREFLMILLNDSLCKSIK